MTAARRTGRFAVVPGGQLLTTARPPQQGDAVDDLIAIEYRPEWRRATWDEDVPSRKAWLVSCAEHPNLGKDHDGEPWGYASSGRAHGVATRHRQAYHSSSGSGSAT